MGIVKKKLSELPESTSLDGLIVLAVDGITNKSSKVGIGLLKGNRGDVGPIGPTGPIGPKGDKGDKGDIGLTGITPNITMSVNSLSPESAPTISKSGTAESPVFVIGIPKGKDGATPTFRTGTNGIEWKYSNEADTSFRSLVGYDVLKLKFTDLTASDITLLQKPATDKVQDLESWKQVAVSDIGNAISGANQARDSAIDVAETTMFTSGIGFLKHIKRQLSMSGEHRVFRVSKEIEVMQDTLQSRVLTTLMENKDQREIKVIQAQ